jgi:hypothetical protein
MKTRAILFAALVACTPEPFAEEFGGDVLVGNPNEPFDGKADNNWTVAQAAANACTTSVASGLSRQLIEEMECIRPGSLARIDLIPGVTLEPGMQPFLQKAASSALERAAQRYSSMYLTSALRSLAQQYMLYTWDQNNWCSHVVYVADPPGQSRHESGLAVDVSNYGAARSALLAEGFSWLGAHDPVHFDYYGGADLRGISVLAFQRLWNANNPGERLAETGGYNQTTASALGRAPASGFRLGASCNAHLDGIEHAIEVYWARKADGSYDLRALANAAIRRVEYYVDGYPIGGANRSDGHNFPDEFRFTTGGYGRDFEVRGYDASDDLVGLGVGLIDVTAGTGVYIRQMGEHLYEIGLERAPDGVAAIEVEVDGYLLVDGETGVARSSRLAVRSQITQPGWREFRITTFSADGSMRGSLFRDFVVR